MTMARTLITFPANARRGEIIEVKAIVAHEMETGFRHTQLGEAIPRDIITHFTCGYNGVEVFSATFYPAIAANPFISFSTVATESGTLSFNWIGDNGFSVTETAAISVS